MSEENTDGKVCPDCKQWKPRSEYWINRKSQDGMYHRCAPCGRDAYAAKHSTGAETVTYTRVRNGKQQTVTRSLRKGEHGYSKKDPTYKVWQGMRRRCREPQAQNYKFYGGKGIKVCPEWDNDYFVFRSWAYEQGYASGLELDRIDSDKDYSPENCRWITKKANIRNRDLSWSDELDRDIVSRAASMGISPYDLIRIAVKEYLAAGNG